MLLDNRTLLFCLIVVYGMMAASLAFVAHSGEREGLRKWAVALFLETFAWLLIAARELIPDSLSIVLANVILSAALAMKLAAIHEYRSLPWPRLLSLLPPLFTAIVFSLLNSADMHGRVLYGSFIYGAQTAFLAYSLWKMDSHQGRAWGLLFASTAAFLPLFALRAIVALRGAVEFSTPESALSPNALQLVIFLFVIAQGIAGSMGFILLIKERADRNNLQLAMTDSLTGLFNRRAFMSLAEKECTFAKRNCLPLALVMIDIDHFKSINDRYGHAAGDAALAGVAKMLSSRLRKQDTIGRYGGEEFCAILPSTDLPGAAAVGEALRAALESTPLPLAHGDIYLTISIGITAYPEKEAGQSPDLDQLFENADAALYQAKREGRNRIVMLAAKTEPEIQFQKTVYPISPGV